MSANEWEMERPGGLSVREHFDRWEGEMVEFNPYLSMEAIAWAEFTMPDPESWGDCQ